MTDQDRTLLRLMMPAILRRKGKGSDVFERASEAAKRLGYTDEDFAVLKAVARQIQEVRENPL